MNFIKRFAGFRLNPNDKYDTVISGELLRRQENGENVGDYVKGLIVFDVNGVFILFDEHDPVHIKVKETIENLPKNKRAQALIELAYERLTATDARTGDPIQETVRIVEVEKAVITERLKIVNVAGEVIQTEQHDDPPSDLDNEGYQGIDSISW